MILVCVHLKFKAFRVVGVVFAHGRIRRFLVLRQYLRRHMSVAMALVSISVCVINVLSSCLTVARHVQMRPQTNIFPYSDPQSTANEIVALEIADSVQHILHPNYNILWVGLVSVDCPTSPKELFGIFIFVSNFKICVVFYWTIEFHLNMNSQNLSNYNVNEKFEMFIL